MKKSTSKNRIKFGRLFIVFFVIYTIYALINQQILISKLYKTEEQKKQNIQEVISKNEKLKEIMEYSNTDEYLEKMAREQLGLVKPEEKVYIDINDKQ